MAKSQQQQILEQAKKAFNKIKPLLPESATMEADEYSSTADDACAIRLYRQQKQTNNYGDTYDDNVEMIELPLNYNPCCGLMTFEGVNSWIAGLRGNAGKDNGFTKALSPKEISNVLKAMLWKYVAFNPIGAVNAVITNKAHRLCATVLKGAGFKQEQTFVNGRTGNKCTIYTWNAGLKKSARIHPNY